VAIVRTSAQNVGAMRRVSPVVCMLIFGVNLQIIWGKLLYALFCPAVGLSSGNNSDIAGRILVKINITSFNKNLGTFHYWLESNEIYTV
jgi:hypothetical protein